MSGVLEGFAVETDGGWIARVTISFPGRPRLVREQGPFATEDEAKAVVSAMAAEVEGDDPHFMAVSSTLH